MSLSNNNDSVRLVLLHKLVNSIRALALDGDSQKALTAPFVPFFEMILDDLVGEIEHIESFETETRAAMLNEKQRADLDGLIKEMRNGLSCVDPGCASARMAAIENTRSKARAILDRHNWNGEIDPKEFQYLDPQTGKLVAPWTDE